MDTHLIQQAVDNMPSHFAVRVLSIAYQKSRTFDLQILNLSVPAITRKEI